MRSVFLAYLSMLLVMCQPFDPGVQAFASNIQQADHHRQASEAVPVTFLANH